VPRALVVFVTALAIFDDIGGILVIALFYGHGVSLPWLAAAAALVALLVLVGRTRAARAPVYAVLGVGLWMAFHGSGIHPTIAGVALGLTIPARPRQGCNPPPIGAFIHKLHPLVAYGVMPLFALVSSGVTVRAFDHLASPLALGAALGLLAGKPLGIFAFTAVALRLRLAPVPGGASLLQVMGVSIVAGIGFTVALFIATLAFEDAPARLEQAKLGVLAGSLAAGLAGFLLLRLTGGGQRSASSAPG
jgi:NhaA family Na+:H+ antiporter